MKPHSIACNRRRLVSVKFYLNQCKFAVVIAKCLGGSLFWDTLYNDGVFKSFRFLVSMYFYFVLCVRFA